MTVPGACACACRGVPTPHAHLGRRYGCAVLCGGGLEQHEAAEREGERLAALACRAALTSITRPTVHRPTQASRSATRIASKTLEVHSVDTYEAHLRTYMAKRRASLEGSPAEAKIEF